MNGSKLVNRSERVPKTANQHHYSVSLISPERSRRRRLLLARLIQGQLRSDRKVYVDYWNEVWNAGFYQHRYAAERAAALGLPSSVSYQGRSVSLEPWLGDSTYRALQIFDKFQEVFGVDSPRVVNVLAGQAGYNNWPEYVSTWGDLHRAARERSVRRVHPCQLGQHVRLGLKQAITSSLPESHKFRAALDWVRANP